MGEEEIKKIKAWLRKKEQDSYLGSLIQDDGLCVVVADELEEFCQVLETVAGPDLIGFPATMSAGGIMFKIKDLERAVYR